MIGRTLIIVAALFAGLICSLAGAWLATSRATPTRSMFYVPADGEVNWAMDTSAAAQRFVIQQSDGLGVRYEAAWLRLDSPDLAASLLNQYVPHERTGAEWRTVKNEIKLLVGSPAVVRESSGIPFRCLSMRAVRQPGIVQPLRTGTLRIQTRPDVYVPIRPIWTGLIANTLIYALVFIAIQRMWSASRRRRRIRRHRCSACAYPIGVSPVCTECGHALPANTPVTPDAKEQPRAPRR